MTIAGGARNPPSPPFLKGGRGDFLSAHFISLFLIMLLTACTSKTFVTTKENVGQIAAEARMRSEKVAGGESILAGQVHIHNRPFGGGRAIVNDHGEPLPSSQDHFMLNTKSVGLRIREIAAEIDAQTGIPVDVTDDAPTSLSSNNGEEGGNHNDCRMAPSYHGTLSRFLDNFGSYCDLTWSYRDGRLKIGIYESQVYHLHSLPSLVTIKSSMASQGLSPTSNTSSSNSASTSATGQSLDTKIDLDSKMDPWKEIKDVLTVLVRPGLVEISPSEQTIVVVGRHTGQMAAKRLIEEINRRQLRQVDFTVQVLNVTTSDNSDLGISLNAIYDQLQGQYKISGMSPTGLPMTGVGTMGVTIQNNSISNKNNKFATSSAVVNALQTIGNVATRDTLTVSARDGRPAPVTVARQLAYLASASTSTNTAATVSSLQEGTLTIGLTMNLLPVIMEDGQIILQYSFGLSSLNALTSVTSNGITLQTPDINVRSSLQEAVVAPGDALVLLGYQEDSLNQQDRGIPGLVDDNFFGFLSGSKSLANSHTALVIIITPQIHENKVSGR